MTAWPELDVVAIDGFPFYLRPSLSRATPVQPSGAAAARQAGRPHASGSPDSYRDGAHVDAGESGP